MPAKKTNKSKKNDSVKLNVTLAVLAALALTFILLAILWEPFEAENMTTYSTGLVGTYLHSRSVSDNAASAVSVLMFVIVSVAAYMLGSMNFAIMTSKALYNEDIRNYGSKNAGMTNMFRVYGKKAGFYTLLGDALKTATAVFLGRLLGGENIAYLAALFCVLGHIAPVKYRFKGGKGVL